VECYSNTQHTKMDLNKKSLPKPKTIKTPKYNPQGLKTPINENPPTIDLLGNKFWFTDQGPNRETKIYSPKKSIVGESSLIVTLNS